MKGVLPPNLSYDSLAVKMELHQTKLHRTIPRQGRNYGIQTIGSTADMRKKKKRGKQAKKIYLLKDPRYNLRSLATAIEDVLHVHDGHDGGRDGGKAAN